MSDNDGGVSYVMSRDIPGAFVECGVGDGGFEELWIQALARWRKPRDIVMYDTFAGLTKPGVFDYTRKDSKFYHMDRDTVMQEWEANKINETANAWCLTPLETVKARLEATGYPKEKLRYIVGDVAETLKYSSNIPESIAILRLDTDWYESSKVELEVLYPKVVSSGIIQFDDYYHWDGQRRATDEYFARRGIVPNILPVGNGKTGYMIKQ